MIYTGPVAYYRLRWHDISGGEKFSSVLTVRRSAEASTIVVLRNPVSDQVPLMIKNIKGSIAYFIHSTNVQQLSKGNIHVTADGQYVIPVGNIHAGTYLLELVSKQEHYSFKIAVD